jgi:uncharacterized OsmC-like protein
MEAARAGVQLTDLKVSVESDSDFRGVLGIDPSVKPGPLAVRTEIELSSPDVGEDQLREIVRRAEEHSPVRDAMIRELSVETEIVIAEGTATDPGLRTA